MGADEGAVGSHEPPAGRAPAADELPPRPDLADHTDANMGFWNTRAAAHAASADYGFERFAADPAHLSDVVRFDRPRLGDVAGSRVVHLQCHIGTDTVSLARLGARVTGLDLSVASLGEARRLARIAGADVDFVHADTYDAVAVLGSGEYDLVYTGVGALNWLPDIARWADVVAGLLRPGGRLFIREAHPVLWALDEDRSDGVLAVEYPYFETAGTAFGGADTYVSTDRRLEYVWTIEFNHGLGEIMTALLAAGMELTSFEEHDSVPWAAFPNLMEPIGGGEHRLVDRPERLPLTYTLQARRR
jgi:SAM-dependent methyltransferase